MLIALRFGNVVYHGGNKMKEYINLVEAWELISVKSNNDRAVGVFKSNPGNCLRGMKASQKGDIVASSAAGGLNQDPVATLNEAVENARRLSKDPSEDYKDITEDTIGMRLLGLSLAEIDVGSVEDACGHLEEAIELHTKIGKWEALARLALTIVEKTEDLDAQSSTARGAVTNMETNQIKVATKNLDGRSDTVKNLTTISYKAANEALHQLKPLMDTDSNQVSSKALDPNQANALASLCLALGIREADESFFVWPLHNIPLMPLGTAKKLVDRTEKMGGGRTLATCFGGSYKSALRSGASKSIEFVFDASSSMRGERFDTCKKSIRMILKEHVNPEDSVGFLIFASYTKEVFPLMLMGGNLEHRLADVAGVQELRDTAFYDAVLEGLQKLNDSPGDASSKWLVTLTDGQDFDSKVDVNPQGSKVCKLLKTSGVNIAVITVGSLPRATINVVGSYVQAAESTGAMGLHVVASDSAKISEAFAHIASIMGDDGLAEAL